MRKTFRTCSVGGVALAVLAANFCVLPALAQDAVQDMRPPEMTPAEHPPVLPPAAETQTGSTTRTLGTLSASDMPPPLLADEHMQPKQVGDVSYITGGIGDEERDTLNAIKADYNLHLTTTGKAGEFVTDSHIVIRDPKGSTVLDAVAGPIFYANLPAGRYTMEASNAGRTETRKISIDKGRQANIYLTW